MAHPLLLPAGGLFHLITGRKTHALIFLCVFSLLCWEASAGPTPGDPQPVEAALPTARLAGTSIVVGSPEERFQIAPGPGDTRQKRLFDSLTPSGQANFLKRREWFLTRLARVLWSRRLSFGFGTVSRGMLRVLPSENANPIAQLSGNDPATQHEIIQQILNGMDQQLWNGSRMIAQVNEFGLQAYVGLSAGATVGKRGYYGAAGLGITVGVDPVQHAFVFELYHSYGHARASTWHLGARAVLRTQLYARNRTIGEPAKVTHGTNYFGFGFPHFGRPMLSVGESSVGIGLVNAVSLLPGGMVEDALEMVNHGGVWVMDSTRVPLLRVTVSPALPYFIKVQTSIDFGKILRAAGNAASRPVVALAGWINGKVRASRPASKRCGRSLGRLARWGPFSESPDGVS